MSPQSIPTLTSKVRVSDDVSRSASSSILRPLSPSIRSRLTGRSPICWTTRAPAPRRGRCDTCDTCHSWVVGQFE